MNLSTNKSIVIFLIFIQFQIVSQSFAQKADDGLADNLYINPYTIYDPTNYLTGSWGGVRDKLVESGITPTSNYFTTILGNPVGGDRQGLKYAGLLNAYLGFNLEKLLNIDGTRFMISGSWASGESLSEEDIGNFFGVSNVFSGNSVRLYQMFLRTDHFESRFNFAIGRMAIGDKFATLHLFNNYVSLAFNENPVSLSLNNPGFFSNPQASWGAWMRAKPFQDFYFLTGVYNSNPRLARDSAHGVDFSFRKGAIIIGEAVYQPYKKGGSSKKPGVFKLGAYYDTGKFARVADDERTEEGNYGFYFIGEQIIYREPNVTSQGLIAWGSVTLAPDEKINTFPFFLSGGMVYEGFLPSRDKDRTAIGITYGAVSEDLRGKDFELLMELSYIFHLKKWLRIQPDIQYIVHPGGSGEIPNALVIGVQLGTNI